MFSTEKPLFLLLPGQTPERTLHQGKVLELEGDTVVAEFAEALLPGAGADVLLYADFRGKFYQNGASVIAVRQSQPTPIIAFRLVGEPMSAESRANFRVSTATLPLAADIGREKNCQIVDISPDGFAAIMKYEYAVGTKFEADLAFEKMGSTGPVRIQTLKRLPNGTLRYGFVAIGGKQPNMQDLLGKLTAEVQRKQLRRLSRTA